MRPFPTRDDWWAARLRGFKTDGSTYSPDTLLFSPFKIANKDARYPPLPANLHDLRYFQGGSEVQRAEADCELYMGILMTAEAAGDIHPHCRWVWREQALAYFIAVRRYGAARWKLSEPVP